MEETDVLVIGGGPAGAGAAITLAKAGCPCAVIESQTAPAWKIGETLAPEARQVLQRLEVWAEFEKDGHLPSPGNCSAWGSDELVSKDFIFNPHGSAWQLDRPKFETRLLNAAVAAGAQIWRGHSWQTIQRKEAGWHVTTKDNVFKAGWLIDASGRGATVARQLGLSREILDKLVTVYAVAASASEFDHDARTQIEACADGWWYSALVPGKQRIFAFQTDADLLPGQEWREEKWFRQRLNETKHIRQLLESPDYRLELAPKLTSAHSSRLESYYGDSWLAVGDAAQSFDPLSGEGLFHALLTGHHAAINLLQSLSGAENALSEYSMLCQSLWNRFLHNRKIYYAGESRWSQEPFWQRRRAHP
jgi:flavin-dependent dehydrogenase